MAILISGKRVLKHTFHFLPIHLDCIMCNFEKIKLCLFFLNMFEQHDVRPKIISFPIITHKKGRGFILK